MNENEEVKKKPCVDTKICQVWNNTKYVEGLVCSGGRNKT